MSRGLFCSRVTTTTRPSQSGPHTRASLLPHSARSSRRGLRVGGLEGWRGFGGPTICIIAMSFSPVWLIWPQCNYTPTRRNSHRHPWTIKDNTGVDNQTESPTPQSRPPHRATKPSNNPPPVCRDKETILLFRRSCGKRGLGGRAKVQPADVRRQLLRHRWTPGARRRKRSKRKLGCMGAPHKLPPDSA